MITGRALLVLALGAHVAACGGSSSGGGSDAPIATIDARRGDASVADGALPDAGFFDAAPPLACGDGDPAALAPGSPFTALRTHATSPLFTGPGHLVADGSTLYVADPNGNGITGDRVLRVTAAGEVTEFSTPGAGAWCTISQLARNSATGHSFIYDVALDRLWDFDAAGTATPGSTVGAIGGGGECQIDSGVIGLIARPDGSFLVGSPLNGMVYTLSADGLTRTDLRAVVQPVFIDLDGAGGAWVASYAGTLTHLSAAGDVLATVPTPGLVPLAVRHDAASGEVFFTAGRSVWRVRSDLTIIEVAGCLPGGAVGLVLAPSTEAGATQPSLYVTAYGLSGASEDGDAIYELQR